MVILQLSGFYCKGITAHCTPHDEDYDFASHWAAWRELVDMRFAARALKVGAVYLETPMLFFLVMTCSLAGDRIYYPNRNYIGVSRYMLGALDHYFWGVPLHETKP